MGKKIKKDIVFEISEKKKNELDELKGLIHEKKNSSNISLKKKKRYVDPLKRVTSLPNVCEEAPVTRSLFPDSKSVDCGFEYIPEIPNEVIFKEDLPDEIDLSTNPSVNEINVGPSISFIGPDIDEEDLQKLEEVKNQDPIDFLRNRLGSSAFNDVHDNYESIYDELHEDNTFSKEGAERVEKHKKEVKTKRRVWVIAILIVCILSAIAAFIVVVQLKDEEPDSSFGAGSPVAEHITTSTTGVSSTLAPYTTTTSSTMAPYTTTTPSTLAPYTTTTPSILAPYTTTLPEYSFTLVIVPTTPLISTTAVAMIKPPSTGTCSSNSDLSAENIQSCLEAGIGEHIIDETLMTLNNASYFGEILVFSIFGETSAFDDARYSRAYIDRIITDTFTYLGITINGNAIGETKLQSLHLNGQAVKSWEVMFRTFISSDLNRGILNFYGAGEDGFQIRFNRHLTYVLTERYDFKFAWNYGYFSHEFLVDALEGSQIIAHLRPGYHVPDNWATCSSNMECYGKELYHLDISR